MMNFRSFNNFFYAIHELDVSFFNIKNLKLWRVCSMKYFEKKTIRNKKAKRKKYREWEEGRMSSKGRNDEQYEKKKKKHNRS